MIKLKFRRKTKLKQSDVERLWNCKTSENPTPNDGLPHHSHLFTLYKNTSQLTSRHITNVKLSVEITADHTLHMLPSILLSDANKIDHRNEINLIRVSSVQFVCCNKTQSNGPNQSISIHQSIGKCIATGALTPAGEPLSE